MGSKQRQVGSDARDVLQMGERTRRLVGCRRDRKGGFKTLGPWENELHRGKWRWKEEGHPPSFPSLLNFGKIY